MAAMDQIAEARAVVELRKGLLRGARRGIELGNLIPGNDPAHAANRLTNAERALAAAENDLRRLLS